MICEQILKNENETKKTKKNNPDKRDYSEDEVVKQCTLHREIIIAFLFLISGEKT